MPSSLKVISSIIGATTGVGGIVTLALWQTGNLGTNAVTESETSLSTTTDEVVEDHTEQSTATQASKNGNCKVVEPLEESIFEGLGIKKNDYTTIYCENTNLGSSDIKLSDKWTGLFPNELLSYEGFELNDDFDLKADTELAGDDSDENYKTTFTGSEFLDSSVVGAWGSADKVVSGKSITTFNVVDEFSTSEKIYLLFTKKE